MVILPSLGTRSQGGSGLPWISHGWIERNVSRGSCQCQGCICNFGYDEELDDWSMVGGHVRMALMYPGLEVLLKGKR